MCNVISYIYSFLYPECQICFEHRPLRPIPHVESNQVDHLVCENCYKFIIKNKICPWCRTEIIYIP